MVLVTVDSGFQKLHCFENNVVELSLKINASLCLMFSWLVSWRRNTSAPKKARLTAVLVV